ncbi:MAG: chemotaxis protein CheW [Verrucomicrobia bacterium]|nr:MAG: chemotaxis protein CheW [Verrucomicrobiota bacterium]
MINTTTDVAIPADARAGKYLSFTLRGESYGIPVLKIREIIRFTRITPLPQVPDFIRGVINLRGKIIPVVDLRLRFNLGTAEVTERTCIIVAQFTRAGTGTLHLGLIVDGVDEVLNIGGEDIEDTPEFGGKLETAYLFGMAKVKSRVIALVDIDRVVNGDTLATTATS